MQVNMQSPPNNTSSHKGISSPQGKKLLDQVSDAIRLKHYSCRTEETYLD